LLIEYELIIKAICKGSECTDGSSIQTIANTLYDQTTGDLRDAIDDGSFVASLQASSQDMATLFANAVASGNFSDVVIPILALISEWYPNWGKSEQICLNDGNAPLYMQNNGYTEKTKESCCERYYSWSYYECLGDTATVPDGFFPDWGSAEVRCVQSTGAGADALPDYMAKNPGQWLYPDIESCCKRYYSWEFDGCVTGSGGSTTSTATLKWYANHRKNMCVQDCPEDDRDTCGGEAQSWNTLYDSAEECCENKLSWIATSTCVAHSTLNTASGTNLWYIDWAEEKCVKDCDGGADCGGLAEAHDNLYDAPDACCEHLWWIEPSKCA